VVPAAVQIVIEPSPLQVASVPEHGGKQVSSTDDVDDVRSAQVAAESASAHVPVTRMPVNWVRHSLFVIGWAHSVTSRLQIFSPLIGRRAPAGTVVDPPSALDAPPELLEVESLDPVPGYGSQPAPQPVKNSDTTADA
jgi:hypothetical protein